MLLKTLVLKADESVSEIFRHLVEIDSYSVLLAVELSHFNELIVAVLCWGILVKIENTVAYMVMSIFA